MNHLATTSWTKARNTLKQVWGYEDFRPPQGEIIHSLLAKKDALIIMPTGGGKSICFQVPALLQTGLTLVISPLVALMENQVQDLRQRQLKAALFTQRITYQTKANNSPSFRKATIEVVVFIPRDFIKSPGMGEIMSTPIDN